MKSFKNLIKSYERWVASNPETACDLETTTKWVSYFIAGRISDSNVVSELIYSLSNMLVLYNDRIIYRSLGSKTTQPAGVGAVATCNSNTSRFCYRLKVMLTTLEYIEVFIEISAKRLFGTKGKWCFVALLQIAKAIGRFFILRHSTEQIITSPAMPSLNRRALIKQQKQDGTGASHNKSELEENSFTFQLKRSGRVLRKVEGAPPMQYRDFKTLIHGAIAGCSRFDAPSISSMPKILLQAEYLYIAKPLVHLVAMGVFGERRWKQFVVAATLDLISIHLYYRNRNLMNKQQKAEMSRRCLNLLLYLMRSPFYDRYTQSRLERVLDFLATHVPLANMIAGPIKDYIPHWQSTYFYLWST